MGAVGLAVAIAVAGFTRAGAADPVASTAPIVPDAPPRTSPPPDYTRPLPSTADLDGLYLWLGPVGGAGYESGAWDSSFGGDATAVRVREQDALAAIGGTFGGALWTRRGGGRLWAEAIVGTELAGHMFGASAGPIVELSATRYPRVGGSIGLWAFFGVTPYVRVGALADAGAFVEMGLHIALPVLRRRY